MNKFSPKSAACGGDTDDFDFGDLVAMTIVDVFETDAGGLLLSYCPTFDNRAVHKTPELAQRIRKGVGQMRETMEIVAKSPVGKSVNMVRKRERESERERERERARERERESGGVHLDYHGNLVLPLLSPSAQHYPSVVFLLNVARRSSFARRPPPSHTPL